MAVVLIPIPARDFDPTEVAVSWSVLKGLGHTIIFATPAGAPGAADDIMVTGRGLDLWSGIPVLNRVLLFGALLRANRDARTVYKEMVRAPEFQMPIRWSDVDINALGGVLLPGGHRARGMREYLESPILQDVVVKAFAASKPVAAICHGVLLAARSIDPATGRSVLHGRRTTALTWKLESAASALAHVGRPWDRDYYRTYTEARNEPSGYMSVQQEVTRALARPEDFVEAPGDGPDLRRKTSGASRDTMTDSRPAFVVTDGRYISARWPGDTYTFARAFAKILEAPPQPA
ncbi:MAG: type 1 glutamine amidotransferase domain-containing protein [Hyphomonadaceae bacterium]